MVGGHQTDLRLGADCAATVTYGKRRQGYQVGYYAPKGLIRYLVEVEPTVVQVGDVLHFGFQTALLSQDTEPIGVLNDSDMILHSYHQSVEEDPARSKHCMQSSHSKCIVGWMCSVSEVCC